MLKRIFFVFVLLLSDSLSAKDVVTIIASDSIPPYVMGNEPMAKEFPGLEVEIIDAALKRKGMKTVWKTMTNKRVDLVYRREDVDAALHLSTFSKQEVHDSDEIISFRNCVIGDRSLTDHWLKSVKELKILGFQGAAGVFREVFAPIELEQSKNYHEVPSQKTVVYHAINGRSDLVLSDALVFAYYAQTYFAPQYVNTNLRCLHEITMARRLSFKNERLKKIFNEGLAALRADGTHLAIVKKYQTRFSTLTKLESSFTPTLIPVAFVPGP